MTTDLSRLEHGTIFYGCIASVSANVLAGIVTLYEVQSGSYRESNPFLVWAFNSTFSFLVSTALHVLLIAIPFLMADFLVHQSQRRKRRRGRPKPRSPNPTADYILIMALWLVIGLTFVDCIRDIIVVLL